MTVTPLIDKKQERFSADFSRLMGSGDIKGAMAEIEALSKRSGRLAKTRDLK